MEFYKGLMLIKTGKANDGCMALSQAVNKNFILETHSELFVLRIQKLVQKGILKSNEVSINFISRNKLGDSEVHHLPLNSQGGFEKKWPGGFFTERMEILTS